MTPWYRDRASLAFLGLRLLPTLAVLNLLWEIAQLPLYTIWRDATPSYLAFAVGHCLAGDLVIAAAGLVIALVATGAGPLGAWRWARIAAVATLAGVAYTSASEWLNTARQAWQYSSLMPKLVLGAGAIGLSPLAQWVVVPPLALWMARGMNR